jgi:hypothetical protein
MGGVATGLLRGGHSAPSINRAVAFYRDFVGIPSDQEPPAAKLAGAMSLASSPGPDVPFRCLAKSDTAVSLGVSRLRRLVSRSSFLNHLVPPAVRMTAHCCRAGPLMC